jgi:rhamnose utilization protein RhaD (predicted bifunctional aldolase and dehydrogenase)
VKGKLKQLICLSREIGRPEHDLAILGEGNTSCSADQESFYVKASGHRLQDIDEDGFARVLFEPVLSAIGRELDDTEVEAALKGAGDAGGPKPSVETFMHAYLLGLPDNEFVAHAHPTPLLALLSTESAREFCEMRLFPDEIVCCGPATAWVPYVDPGLKLGEAVRDSTEAFVKEHGMLPKVYWMENHGLTTVGRSAKECEAAFMMAVKAGRAYLEIAKSGRGIQPLPPATVERIVTRPDEHHRQRIIEGLRSE